MVFLIAEFLSSILGMKVVPVELHESNMLFEVEEDRIFLFGNLFGFKEELANAQKLSSGVDIFVNESFSQSHKVLSSTVVVARFCYACIAGFSFEQGLRKLKNISRTVKRPYAAIIGGSGLVLKSAAIKYLASVCDGLVFVGNMAFQIMYALGLFVPANLIEPGAFKEGLALVEYMRSRGIHIVLPRDFLCSNTTDPENLEIFASDCLLEGWRPVDLGPESLEEITSFLSKCKKVLWIGPDDRVPKLAGVLHCLKQRDMDVVIVGKMISSIIFPQMMQLQVLLLFGNFSKEEALLGSWPWIE